jgi:hypothetical protein
MDRNDKIQALISGALKSYMEGSARSIQASEGRLGPSDIGFCRQKAALMTRGIAATDDTPKWAAAVGTAIHNYVEAAIKEAHPDWLLGSIDNVTVTATLPSGAEISGHPDIVVPQSNAVLDIKTVDGFEWVKREGTSLQHKYQRHLYAMGLIQAGILDGAQTVLVGNIYFDRSGKNPDPLVLVEEMDPTLTNEIDSWIQDVIYAVKNQEDASRDIPAAVCERICSHFTVCRGALETQDEGEFIDNPELLAAVDMYVTARETKKQAEAAQKAAQAILDGVNGSTGTYQVRWVDVQPTTVESFEKAAYRRMDIRKVRR